MPSTRCTAPRRGHESEVARSKCPSCGPHFVSVVDALTVAPVALRPPRDPFVVNKPLLMTFHWQRWRNDYAIDTGDTTTIDFSALLAGASDDERRRVLSMRDEYEMADWVFGEASTIGEITDPGPFYIHASDDRPLEYLNEMRLSHLEWCGVDRDNTHAVEMLSEGEWWQLTPQSPEVLLGLSVSRNK